MYKRLIPVLFFIGSAAAAIAQPSLTQDNSAPQMWSSYVNIICDTGVNQGALGAGVTWDFSPLGILIPVSVDTGSAYPCSATPNCSLFPGSTYAIVSHATTFTPYYIVSASKLSENGFYQSADTFATFTDPMDQIQYPFTYSDHFTDTYSGLLHYGPNTAVQSGTISVTADGYGTLKLPGIPGLLSAVTFSNVLRVHTSQNYTDSLSLFGLPLIETFTVESYSWYMPGYHNALMTIDYTTGPAGSGYNNKVVSVSPVGANVLTPNVQIISSSLELFPNPVNDELNIKYTTVNNENVRISLADMLGREVAVITDGYTQGAQQLSYNTTALPKGLYLVRFQTGAENVTKKVEIQ